MNPQKKEGTLKGYMDDTSTGNMGGYYLSTTMRENSYGEIVDG